MLKVGEFRHTCPKNWEIFFRIYRGKELTQLGHGLTITLVSNMTIQQKYCVLWVVLFHMLLHLMRSVTCALHYCIFTSFETVLQCTVLNLLKLISIEIKKKLKPLLSQILENLLCFRKYIFISAIFTNTLIIIMFTVHFSLMQL